MTEEKVKKEWTLEDLAEMLQDMIRTVRGQTTMIRAQTKIVQDQTDKISDRLDSLSDRLNGIGEGLSRVVLHSDHRMDDISYTVSELRTTMRHFDRGLHSLEMTVYSARPVFFSPAPIYPPLACLGESELRG